MQGTHAVLFLEILETRCCDKAENCCVPVASCRHVIIVRSGFMALDDKHVVQVCRHCERSLRAVDLDQRPQLIMGQSSTACNACRILVLPLKP